VAYDKARARPKAPGLVRVLVDNAPVGEPVRFNAETQGALTLPDMSRHLTAGKHSIKLVMEDGSEMPYAMSVRYHAMTPASSEETKVSLEVALGSKEVREGELMEATAVVQNRTTERLPTVVAIIGVPGGLEARHHQLKELVKRKVIDAYEVRGREVVVYWRGMEPKRRARVSLSLIAAVPGTYRAPASRAYLYYTDEHKTWVEGLSAVVTPKGL
jgi:hypothetical protein